MARREMDEFAAKGAARVYLAGSLREARRVEALLDAEQVDYAQALEKFVWPGIFTNMDLDGVAFYVSASAADSTRTKLHKAGLKKGVVREDDAGGQDDGSGQSAPPRPAR